MSGISTGAALLIASGVTAATAIGTTVYSAMNQPSSPTAAQTSTQQAQAQEDAAQAQAQALERRRGMASTQLTSPLGTGTAQIQKATLG